MKKLSIRHKKVLLYRSLKRLRAHKYKKSNKKNFYSYVTLWDGKAEERALCQFPPILPPSDIDFEGNIENTLSFLEVLRERLGKKKATRHRKLAWIKRRKHKIPIINSYYDFSSIENLSISPAMVIAACYDRAKRLAGLVPPAVNYRNWTESAFQTFYEIGFFDLIGQNHHEVIKEEYENKANKNVRILRAISGKNADNLELCSNSVSDLLRFLVDDDNIVYEYIPDINTAISEAMINVARHAYPVEYVENSLYDTIDQWWITARADRENHTITIVIYDQGASIPYTLPHKSRFRGMVAEYMKKLFPNFKYSEKYRRMDHEYINYSMKPGSTQTESPERGLGLPQMQDLVNLCDSGYIMVVSRAGFYRYEKGTDVIKRALPIELEGTLVEWHLSLPHRKAM